LGADEENKTEGNWISSTGLSILEKVKGAFSNKIFYYVIGIIIFAGVFVVARRRFRSSFNNENSGRRDFSIGGRSNDIREAERRLREAQEEVKKLRNTDKIKELENELRRLKGED